eukprot:jgi/Chlat1/4813/Chrsp31S04796
MAVVAIAAAGAVARMEERSVLRSPTFTPSLKAALRAPSRRSTPPPAGGGVRCGLEVHAAAGTLLDNKALWTAAVACVLAQAAKPFTTAAVTKQFRKFTIKEAFRSGGMPSSHSAVSIGGWDDPLCAVCIVLACIVMYDAQLPSGVTQGVRKQAGIHAGELNRIIADLADLQAALPEPIPLRSTLALEARKLNQVSMASAAIADPSRYACFNGNGASTSSSTSAMLALSPVDDSMPSVSGYTSASQQSNSTQSQQQQRKAGGVATARERIALEAAVTDCLGTPDTGESPVAEDAVQVTQGNFTVTLPKYPLKETIGHKKSEVLAGALFGILVGFLVG